MTVTSRVQASQRVRSPFGARFKRRQAPAFNVSGHGTSASSLAWLIAWSLLSRTCTSRFLTRAKVRTNAMPMPSLDARINELFREKEALTLAGQAGNERARKGWTGT